MSLRLPYLVRGNLLWMANVTWPDEACGVVMIRKDNPDMFCVVPIKNVADNPLSKFAFDPQEQIALAEFVRACEDMKLVAIWHSHTTHSIQPSKLDLLSASYQSKELVHLIVFNGEIKGYRVLDQENYEEVELEFK